MVGSCEAGPTVTVVTVPPAASFNSSPRTSAYHSSYGFTMNCTPFVSKRVSPSVKAMRAVVSGTWLMRTRIFMRLKNVGR